MIDKYKVEFESQEEINYLLKLLGKIKVKKKHKKSHKKILHALENPKFFKANSNKTNATKKASDARIKATKNKIQNALDLLRFEGKIATVANVATTAGIGYNTSKKYAALFKYENHKK